MPYARWQELEAALRSPVGGKTVAMEVSPGNAVPYLDRVPSGVVEMVTKAGARVVSSAPRVTGLTARWSPEGARDHVEAAEILAAVAKDMLAEVVHQAGRVTESEVQRRVIEALEREGLAVDKQHLLLIYDRIPHGWNAIPADSTETNSFWLVRATMEE